MWMFQLCHQLFPDLLCVKNVCCLTVVMIVNVPAVPSGKTCSVSEFLLPQCCHMNVPAVPSVVAKPVMCQNVRCLTAVRWMFQLCHHLFPDLLCQNVCCPTAVMWMFQLCRHLFPDLLCQNVCCPTAVTWFSNCSISCSQTCYVRMSVAPLLSHECSNSAIACSSICYVLSEFLLFTAVWNTVNVAVELILALSLLWISCVTDSWLPHTCCEGCFCQDFCLDLMCVWICAAVQLFQIVWMLQLCCHFFVDLICVWSSVALWLFQIMCISQLCHLFFWDLLYVNLCRCYKWMHITAVLLDLMCVKLSAASQLVEGMWILWLCHDFSPGYLSESLLLHSYWNGCEYYGCVVTFYYISCVLDSPLPHSCCCAITSPCVCCVSKSLIAATGDLNGMAVLWHLCGSVVFLNFCCLQLLQGMWTLLAVSS